MNILIVEDEINTAQLLKTLIEEHKDCLVVNTCESISAAVAYLSKHQNKLDLIFMDIQLADGLSFQIFKQIEIIRPVVFCTAYNQYTLEAFKNNGIDYILKPFQQQDIDATLQKVSRIKSSFVGLSEIVASTPTVTSGYQSSFIIRSREKMIPIAVNDIAFFHLDHEVVYVYKFNGEASAIFKTMDEIEQCLDPTLFFRINRQMIVQRKAIADIEPYFNRKVIVNLAFTLKEKAIVSRLKVSPFKEWIEKA